MKQIYEFHHKHMEQLQTFVKRTTLQKIKNRKYPRLESLSYLQHVARNPALREVMKSLIKVPTPISNKARKQAKPHLGCYFAISSKICFTERISCRTVLQGIEEPCLLRTCRNRTQNYQLSKKLDDRLFST